ncbi:Uncharacterised protein [Legionella busanensis]|uniref:Uncharacterized protein n=1 Tax=Legionella busanensis TaxID=190655 RepID=A0A378JJZ7_9GAMM|nr:hypothetical protein [Legionella busanensis]STX51397.1 Uncharacterised protein [Legionella busanensis]
MMADIDKAIKTGEYLLAEHLALQALADKPGNLTLRYRIGSIYLRQGKLEEAALHLEFFYKQDSNNVANISTYTTVLARLGQYDLAFSILKSYEDKFGMNSRLLYTKADLFIRLLNWPVAKKYLTLYRDNYAENLAVETAYCSVLIKLREFDIAKQLLEQLRIKYQFHSRIETLIREVNIESIRHENTLRHIKQSQHKPLVTYLDHLTNADTYYEFYDIKIASDKYRHITEVFPEYIEPKVALIQSALAMGSFTNALYLWENILNSEFFDLSLLSLERLAQSYSSEKEIAHLALRTKKKIKKELPNYKQNLKKIAIVGGSNSIMLKDWWPAFRETMLRLYGINADNYGLGGISSLYGLTLIKDKHLFEHYDLLIFEYTLNDIYFHSLGGYSEQLIRAMTEELAYLASKTNCKLIFLELSPLSELDKSLYNTSVIANIYKQTACKYNINYFSATDFIKSELYSRSNIEQLYTDDMHYTSRFAHKLSNQLIKKILTEPLHHPIFIPKKNKNLFNLHGINLIKPNQVTIKGKSVEVYRETQIIKSQFIKIEKIGLIEFSLKPGQMLLGIMINSTIATGYIKIYFGKDKIFIKNIYAERASADKEKPRIFLRQFSEVLQAKTYTNVRITPNVTMEDLSKYPLDITAYPAKPLCELDSQELEFSGLLIA